MAKEEWILGQPVEAQTVYEWVEGQPHILVEEEEAPGVGNPWNYYAQIA